MSSNTCEEQVRIELTTTEFLLVRIGTNETMDRRKYIGSVVGLALAPAIAGCLQGDPVLHKTQISATSPTMEWDLELDESNRMRLEVEKNDDSAGSIRGFVDRANTNEEIATTTDSSPDARFEVPRTGTYTVSVDPQGATGEITLRDLY